MNKFIILIALLCIFSAYPSCAEEASTNPFSPTVQLQVFKKVAQLMWHPEWAKNKPSPPIFIAEEMTDAHFAWAVNCDFFGDKRGNFYSWRMDAVILSLPVADVDSLAHEYAHYFQFHFMFGEDHSLFTDIAEMQAIRIQQHFK